MILRDAPKLAQCGQVGEFFQVPVGLTNDTGSDIGNSGQVLAELPCPSADLFFTAFNWSSTKMDGG
jgi:hypothetical protein